MKDHYFDSKMSGRGKGGKGLGAGGARLYPEGLPKSERKAYLAMMKVKWRKERRRALRDEMDRQMDDEDLAKLLVIRASRKAEKKAAKKAIKMAASAERKAARKAAREARNAARRERNADRQFDKDLGVRKKKYERWRSTSKLAAVVAEGKAARRADHAKRRRGDTTACPAEAYRVKAFCRKRRS